jgi:hypothetical protein
MIYFTDIDSRGLELHVNGYCLSFGMFTAEAVIRISGASYEDSALIRACYAARASINAEAEGAHIALQALARFFVESFPLSRVLSS